MPLQLNTPSIAAGTGYGCIVVGQAPRSHHIKVDLSTLTTDEVDTYGYIKPGVPLRLSGGLGVLISGSSQVVDGVVYEAQKLALATLPPTNTSLGSETGDHFVAVGTHFTMNRDIAEDNLGRAISANEITGLGALTGPYVYLTST